MTTNVLPGLGGRIAIRVHGVPVPQGSKVANRYGSGVRDANATNLHPWRDTVRGAAEDQCRYHDTLTGPVRVWVRFTFVRPRSHFLTDGIRLSAGAARFPGHGCGDVDKLQRAIFDALTDAKVWADDTQVVDVRARKFYAGEDELALDHAGVDIIIEELA